MFTYLPVAACAVFLYMNIAFIVAMIKRDNSVVDIFWGPGFVLLAAVLLVSGTQFSARSVLVFGMVALWGIRLGIYILIRNKGRGEDFRYAAWRKNWKYFRVRSYFQIFMLQGSLMLLISWPVLHSIHSPETEIGITGIIGLAVFLTGFLFEAFADAQMQKFKKTPSNKGQLLTTGLWKYTRHPNYFGEALLWWGFWILAVPVVNGIFTLVSPVIISLLLRYVSGVPMLERKYEGRPDWEEYKAKTPVFIPFLK